MREYGVFNDEGLLDGGIYDRTEANSIADKYKSQGNRWADAAPIEPSAGTVGNGDRSQTAH